MCACRPGCHCAPGAGARNGTASTHTRSPGPAVGTSTAGLAALLAGAFRAADAPVVRPRVAPAAVLPAVFLAAALLPVAVLRRRPGMPPPESRSDGRARLRRFRGGRRRV